MTDPMPTVTSPESTIWMELARDDFVDALKMLSPGRMLKSRLAQELQIGLVNGEAVFCIEGAITRCPACGDWNGFVSLAYGSVAPYIRVRPSSDPVRLTFEGQRLKLEQSRFPARWTEVSPWISDMVLNAHFLGSDETPLPKLWCPSCGKRDAVAHEALLAQVKRSQDDETLLMLLERHGATHACRSCRYGWRALKLN